MTYPWQEQNWHQLITRYRQHNLPHAMLFTGVSGLGKFVFATDFAQFLLCKNNINNNRACETCESCALFKANTHPDFLLVQPEDVGKAIKVEQIRQMIFEASGTAHQGGVRVVVLNVADAMNISAANALLKTLEEPLGDVILILVSARPSALPATIISRCQKIEFVSPSLDNAMSWLMETQGNTSSVDIKTALHLAHNAPLQALSFMRDGSLALRQKILTDLLLAWREKNPKMHAVTFAATYAEVDSSFLLRFFLDFVNDLIKLQAAIASEFITNIEQEPALRDICKSFSGEKLLEYQSYLLGLCKVIGNNITLNKQLLLENLWLRLQATRYVS